MEENDGDRRGEKREEEVRMEEDYRNRGSSEECKRK